MESFVNFGNIACGTSTTHLLHIKNNSHTVKAAYQVIMPIDTIYINMSIVSDVTS